MKPQITVSAPQKSRPASVLRLRSMLKIIGLSLLLPFHAQAADYHLSPVGSNGDNGSKAAPWKTLSHAAAMVQPGDTVWLHTGTWNERLVVPTSGTQGAMITFRAIQGETPEIDGTGIVFSDIAGLVDLSNRSYIRVEGLKLKNFTTAVAGRVPVGILIQGNSVGCEIVGNELSYISSTAPVNGQLLGRDAHGIAVYGNASTSISNLLIRGNELRNLTLGSSEAMVINGNVDGFRVLDNHVHDCDNIGIDAIGFEGIAPSGAVDQARNGVIAGNHVHAISSAGNPAYGGDTSADGIYVDGGKDIIIERNHVHHCDIGIEVASEHKNKVTSNITVRSNIMRENLLAGLFIGGYNKDSTGDADGCKVTFNTFYNNDTLTSGDEYGQIHLQFRVTNCTFSNNILYHTISKGGNNLFIVHWNTTGGGNVFNSNQFYGTASPVWVLNDDWTEGWSDYENHAWSGAQEAWGDPGFLNAASLDFTPSLVDTGDGSAASATERDYNGMARSHGSAPDRGAIEVAAAPYGLPSMQIQKIGPGGLLNWTAPIDYYMDLERSDDLQNWYATPGEDSILSAGTVHQKTEDLAAQPRQFYRVRIH